MMICCAYVKAKKSEMRRQGVGERFWYITIQGRKGISTFVKKAAEGVEKRHQVCSKNVTQVNDPDHHRTEQAAFK